MLRFLKKTSLYILAIPALFYALGFASNQAVLWANHDRFPVMWSDYKVASYDLMLHEKLKSKNKEIVTHAEFNIQALEEYGYIDDVHCVMTSETHLNALADVFDLGTTYSIGDALLFLGEWLMSFALFVWIFAVVRKLNEEY